MTQEKKINLANINSIADLQTAQHRLKMQIREQEKELKERVKVLPGELVYAGVNAVIPTVLSGKITNSVLGMGKELVNMFFVKREDGEHRSKLVSAIKKAGIFSVLRLAFKAFIQRK